VVVYLAVVITAYRAYALTRFSFAPQPKTLRDLYLREPNSTTQERVLDTLVEVFRRNQRVVARKVRWIRASFVALLAETFVVGLLLLTQNLH
jgi:hypothetical protein